MEPWCLGLGFNEEGLLVLNTILDCGKCKLLATREATEEEKNDPYMPWIDHPAIQDLIKEEGYKFVDKSAYGLRDVAVRMRGDK